MIRGRSALESVIDRGIAHDGPIYGGGLAASITAPRSVTAKAKPAAAGPVVPVAGKSVANTVKPVANKPGRVANSPGRYADKEKRAAYMREYMARKRGAKCQTPA